VKLLAHDSGLSLAWQAVLDKFDRHRRCCCPVPGDLYCKPANTMATIPPAPPGPPTQRVSDVITSFRPSRVRSNSGPLCSSCTDTSSQRFKPSAPTTSVTSLDFDDTGELAVVARDDDTIQIYNCKEGKHAKELKSQKYGVHLARFSHHAQSIIFASTKVDGILDSHQLEFLQADAVQTQFATSPRTTTPSSATSEATPTR
jgi:WD40 repeat protein